MAYWFGHKLHFLNTRPSKNKEARYKSGQVTPGQAFDAFSKYSQGLSINQSHTYASLLFIKIGNFLIFIISVLMCPQITKSQCLWNIFIDNETQQFFCKKFWNAKMDESFFSLHFSVT